MLWTANHCRWMLNPIAKLYRLNIKLITPRGGNLPSARAYHSMVALDNSLVLYGGKDGNTLSPVPLALFDYRGKRWSYPGA